MIALKTHYGLDALNKPENILPAIKNMGHSIAFLSDKLMGGAVDFFIKCKELDIKPVIGLFDKELFYARNKTEYKELIRSFSEKRKPEGVIEIVGLPHGEMANLVFKSYYNDLVLNDDVFEIVKEHIALKLAGPNKIYLAITKEMLEAHIILNQLMKDISIELNIPIIQVDECYYEKPEESIDHIIQLSYSLKSKDGEQPDEDMYKRFYLSDQFCLSKTLYDEAEFNGQFESYDILSVPQIPIFESDKSPDDKLRELCIIGWKEKIVGKPNIQEYIDRIKTELELWKKYELSSYFLIMHDIVKWCTDQGWLLGTSRGSGGGCLTTYLIGINHIDPIKHDLLLERFHNPSRVGDLPDLDQDVPKFKRAEIIEYIKNKYGDKSVSQIITYSRLGARSALKNVLRYYNFCSYDQMNILAELFPEPAKVEDQMKASGHESLILWSLENFPERFAQYVRLENDQLVGDYAQMFDKAIKLESLIVDFGQHASGIIVYSGEITEVSPLMDNKKEDGRLCVYDMDAAPKVGLVKLDLLGLATLDRIMLILDLIQEKLKVASDIL